MTIKINYPPDRLPDMKSEDIDVGTTFIYNNGAGDDVVLAIKLNPKRWRLATFSLENMVERKIISKKSKDNKSAPI